MWVTSENWEQTEKDILQYIEQFKKEFPPPKKAKQKWFCYMLFIIRQRFFLPDNPRKGSRGNSAIDYSSVSTLYASWGLYKRLCLQNEIVPTVQMYCRLIGLTEETVSSWKHGRYRTLFHSEFIKDILEQCEAELVSNTIDNGSIGSMFVLKSKYGWKESNPGMNISFMSGGTAKQNYMSKEQIQQRLNEIETAESREREKDD